MNSGKYETHGDDRLKEGLESQAGECVDKACQDCEYGILS